MRDMTMAEGTKHDSGKPRMSLLDPLFLTTVAEVLTFGAQKYAAHNWRNGLEVSRLLDAALRHLNAFNDGQDLDPESGISHLGHASCCLMFALRMVHDRPDLDDRYKPDISEQIVREYSEYVEKARNMSTSWVRFGVVSKEQ